MTQPTEDIRLDPHSVRVYSKDLENEAVDLWAHARSIRKVIRTREPYLMTDDFVWEFHQRYRQRALQVEERYAATAKRFLELSETAIRVADNYEREDAASATNVAREEGLLPPR